MEGYFAFVIIQHMDAAKDHGIEMIDLVAVNLYPFEETVARANGPSGHEQIDIGGPSMLQCG